ncbi:unnamed protein product [Bursaphelenchus xylophilus]|uniref:(pine wood nematode) hypothetical protein n=1 Tax=Bursaphelenchus xylophilus TaxID=6326 RepID=A0A7I8XQW1_BURXY|nr:unnamed protein product [Bursaphelenchus xylophilus]CAG9087520.1 unnamed protein product [Bursaphelenchus xylophilus]
MMEEAQYDVPWEFKLRNSLNALKARPQSAGPEPGPSHFSDLIASHHRDTSTGSFSSAKAVPNSSPVRVKFINTPSPPANERGQRQASVQRRQHEYYPRVNIGVDQSTDTQFHHKPHKSTPILFSETPQAERRHRSKFDEKAMIHENMDRVEAEKILSNGQVGDYLLRQRPEGNLAMSLRGQKAVLHIKLEQRNGKWILGEGPEFRSLGSVLRCYRNSELPIKNAENVRLREPVRTDEIHIVTQKL